MVSENEFPFSTRQLLKGLPAERSAAEIGDKYRALFAECIDEYVKSRVGALSHVNKIPELTISLAKDVALRFGRLLEWADELIPEFDLKAISSIPNYATRSVASTCLTANRTVESYAFEKFGDKCSAKIALEVMESNLDLTISLHGDDGEMLLPFNLSITDQESGQTLLRRKEFTSGAARIRGVERGAYAICCEQDGRVCEFSITVR